MKDELRYVRPKGPKVPSARRVYALPIDLVKEIHRYGHAKGHPTEVSAVKELLEAAVKQWSANE